MIDFLPSTPGPIVSTAAEIACTHSAIPTLQVVSDAGNYFKR
jgi:hypothetical protein